MSLDILNQSPLNLSTPLLTKDQSIEPILPIPYSLYTNSLPDNLFQGSENDFRRYNDDINLLDKPYQNPNNIQEAIESEFPGYSMQRRKSFNFFEGGEGKCSGIFNNSMNLYPEVFDQHTNLHQDFLMPSLRYFNHGQNNDDDFDLAVVYKSHEEKNPFKEFVQKMGICENYENCEDILLDKLELKLNVQKSKETPAVDSQINYDKQVAKTRNKPQTTKSDNTSLLLTNNLNNLEIDISPQKQRSNVKNKKIDPIIKIDLTEKSFVSEQIENQISPKRSKPRNKLFKENSGLPSIKQEDQNDFPDIQQLNSDFNKTFSFGEIIKIPNQTDQNQISDDKSFSTKTNEKLIINNSPFENLNSNYISPPPSKTIQNSIMPSTFPQHRNNNNNNNFEYFKFTQNHNKPPLISSASPESGYNSQNISQPLDVNDINFLKSNCPPRSFPNTDNFNFNLNNNVMYNNHPPLHSMAQETSQQLQYIRQLSEDPSLVSDLLPKEILGNIKMSPLSFDEIKLNFPVGRPYNGNFMTSSMYESRYKPVISGNGMYSNNMVMDDGLIKNDVLYQNNYNLFNNQVYTKVLSDDFSQFGNITHNYYDKQNNNAEQQNYSVVGGGGGWIPAQVFPDDRQIYDSNNNRNIQMNQNMYVMYGTSPGMVYSQNNYFYNDSNIGGGFYNQNSLPYNISKNSENRYINILNNSLNVKNLESITTENNLQKNCIKPIQLNKYNSTSDTIDRVQNVQSQNPKNKTKNPQKYDSKKLSQQDEISDPEQIIVQLSAQESRKVSLEKQKVKKNKRKYSDLETKEIKGKINQLQEENIRFIKGNQILENGNNLKQYDVGTYNQIQMVQEIEDIFNLKFTGIKQEQSANQTIEDLCKLQNMNNQKRENNQNQMIRQEGIEKNDSLNFKQQNKLIQLQKIQKSEIQSQLNVYEETVALDKQEFEVKKRKFEIPQDGNSSFCKSVDENLNDKEEFRNLKNDIIFQEKL